jgi:hypothetical protein
MYSVSILTLAMSLGVGTLGVPTPLSMPLGVVTPLIARINFKLTFRMSLAVLSYYFQLMPYKISFVILMLIFPGLPLINK